MVKLPCISPFDCIGEPATLAQRWDKWKAEFELYVVASGVDDKVQLCYAFEKFGGTL